MIETKVDNISLNSGWELVNGQRRSFEYTGDNITTIYLQKIVKGSWVTVFKQELTCDGDKVLTITGTKL